MAKEEAAVFEGRLDSIWAPDLLTFINMIKKTGVLELRNGTLTKRIFWEKGELIFANSSDPSESLGSFLIRHGKITKELSLKAGLQITPEKRQGRILIEMGTITPKDLWWAVKNQVLDIVYSVFSWKNGIFSFFEMESPHEEKIKLSTSTTNIIMEGIRRIDEWPRIHEYLPNDRVILEKIPESERDNSVHFYDAEMEVFNLIDGEKTIREIIHNSKMEEFDTLRLLLSFLLAKYSSIKGEQTPKGMQEDIEDTGTLISIFQSYNEIIKEIVHRSKEPLSFQEIANDPVLAGVQIAEDGSLDPKVLLSNVAELPAGKRAETLEESLNNFLSMILFEATPLLSPEDRQDIFKMFKSLHHEGEGNKEN